MKIKEDILYDGSGLPQRPFPKVRKKKVIQKQKKIEYAGFCVDKYCKYREDEAVTVKHDDQRLHREYKFKDDPNECGI